MKKLATFLMLLSAFSGHQLFANPLYNFSAATVVKGKQQARTLGMPTANIYPKNLSLTPGTYAGYAQRENTDHMEKALFYVPSEAENRPGLLEVHFLDMPHDTDLYGQDIEGTVMHFIRAPEAWTSFDAMKSKIEKDKELCLKALS